MTYDEFMAEARRYAEHAFCYGGLVDDATEALAHAHACGFDVYDTLDEIGESYDLDRADSAANWGINHDKPFERKY